METLHVFLTNVKLPFLELAVGFTVFTYLVETYLDLRQRWRLESKTLPSELDGAIPVDKFLKAQEYGISKNKFSIGASLFDTVLELLILADFWLPLLWKYTSDFMLGYGYGPEYEILHSCFFIVAYSMFSLIIKLPFGMYETFQIEEKFGFNKSTIGRYFSDMAKQLVLGMVIGLPLLAAVLQVIKWGGKYFYVYVWALVTTFSLVMATVYPNLIAPLFNKFTPLPAGPLRSDIEQLCVKIGFPLTQLYVIDGSVRSAHSNAYFYGFFKSKRIVLYDTLLEQFKDDPSHAGIIAILAHELGHYKLQHVWKNLVIALVYQFFEFFLFGLIISNQHLYRSFGFEPAPTLIGLLCFMKINEPLNHIFGLAMNVLSRRFEYQADAFATKLDFSLEQPLIVMQIENLSNMNPDPWYSAYHNSHPTLVERLRAIKALKLKKE